MIFSDWCLCRRRVKPKKMGGGSKESSAEGGVFCQMILQLIDEVERLKQTNYGQGEMYNNLAYKYEELKHSFEEVTSEKVSLTEDNERLTAEMDSCNGEVKRVEDKCRAEMDILKAALEEEKKEIDKCCNSKVKDIKDECDGDLKKQVLEYEKTNSEGQDEQARLKLEIIRLEGEVVKVTHGLEESNRDAEDKIKDLEAQIEETCQILRNNTKSADSKLVAEMVKNEELKEKVTKLTGPVVEMKHGSTPQDPQCCKGSYQKTPKDDNERLTPAEMDETTVSCNMEVQKVKDECRTEITELKAGFEEAKSQIGASWNDKMNVMKGEHELQYVGLKKKVDECETKLSAAAVEEQKLRRELEDRKRETEDKMKDVEAQSLKQCQIMRNHIESADSTAVTGMNKNEELKGQVAKLTREVEHLKQGSTPHDPQFSKESSKKIHQEMQDLRQKCKDAERAIYVKDLTIKDLSTRLSSEMGKKVSADEKCLENINIKNRPMNVATEYENICSSEWLEAKGVLDKQLCALTEERKAMFLRRMFFITEREATGKIRAFNSQLLHLFNSPSDLQGEAEPMKINELPIEMSNAAGDLLRSRADGTDVSCIIQMTNTIIAKEFPTMLDLVNLDGIQQYVRACSRLAWKMVIQRPAMGFVEKGLGEPWRGANQQEVCWYSADPSHPTSRVDYFIHPALCHGNTPMVKGRVHLSST